MARVTPVAGRLLRGVQWPTVYDGHGAAGRVTFGVLNANPIRLRRPRLKTYARGPLPNLAPLPAAAGPADCPIAPDRGRTFYLPGLQLMPARGSATGTTGSASGCYSAGVSRRLLGWPRLD